MTPTILQICYLRMWRSFWEALLDFQMNIFMDAGQLSTGWSGSGHKWRSRCKVIQRAWPAGAFMRVINLPSDVLLIDSILQQQHTHSFHQLPPWLFHGWWVATKILSDSIQITSLYPRTTSSCRNSSNCSLVTDLQLCHVQCYHPRWWLAWLYIFHWFLSGVWMHLHYSA